MDNSGEMLQLCRLCLVKDDVNIPIFEEQGDIRKIFLKISSCLPVKVSRDDKLPKKICDGCSYKLDMLYEFWNTTANAEKQLLSWLGEAGMNSKMTDDTMTAVAQQIKPAETFVKQEAIDPSDIHTEENDDDKTYMFQQKFTIEEGAGPSATVTSNTSNEEEEPPPKRARRTAAVKAQIAMDPESDDDEDSGEPLTKVEDESEDSDGEDHEPAFVDVPSTSADDQPGPSGVGKDGVEAPFGVYKIESGIYKCVICDRSYANSEKLRKHRSVHKDKNIPCEICGKMFKHNHEMQKHKKIQHLNEGTYYNCEFCDKKCQTKTILKIHVDSVHLNKRRFYCKKCPRGFNLLSILETHDKVEHQQLLFTCQHCNKGFKDKRYFQSHIKTHDTNYINAGFRCQVCSKVLKYRDSLNKHMKSHTGKNRNVCDICGKVVTSKYSLKHHIRTHTGEKPFQCNYCEKRFINRNVLVTHERIHTKEKPFKCKVCDKCFSQKASMNIHMRYHTGERPYNCSVCLKRFITNTLLKDHHCKGPSRLD